MAFGSFNCLSTTKGPGPLDQVHRLIVIRTACFMYKDRSGRQGFSTSICEGYVQTEWRAYQIGLHFGTVFKAYVHNEQGAYELSFLLSEEDLIHGLASFTSELEEGETFTARAGYWNDETMVRDLQLASMMSSGTTRAN